MDPLVTPEPGTVIGVFRAMARDPLLYLVVRWNWKSAVTSAIVRGIIFFSVNYSAGRRAALGAMTAELGYRTLLSGCVGSLTQAFRKSEPAWVATLMAMLLMPLFTHSVEFTVHWLRGTPRLAASIVASVGFTVLSIIFNLYAMRRGVLVVGDGNSLARDFKRMPRVIGGFLAVVPVLLWRAIHGSRQS
jgi:hypothetical protein